MSRWIRSTNDPAWAALFEGFRESAYRLEAQQIYSNDTEDEALERFRAGEPFRPIDPWPAITWLHAMAAAGQSQTRVRVVLEPPTDYTRLELVAYPYLAAAGEDIRIIAVQQGDWPAGLPRNDYWLFDDHDAWRMHYSNNQRFVGAEQIEDEDAVQQHLAWREMALAQAVPLSDYLGTKNSDRR